MSERYFYLRELREDQIKGQGAFPTAWIVTESEFHRRIDLAFRAAFCTLDEKFDYDKAVEILVHGKGWDQHDLPGCEEEAGPNWKVGEKGEDERKYACEDYGKLMTAAEGGATFTVCEECWDKYYKRKQSSPAPVQEGPLYTNRAPEPTQPSPAPTREEWEAWADELAGYLCRVEAHRDWVKRMLLSMPIVPKSQVSAPTREEWRIWIQDLPRPADDWSDMNAWLDAVEIWLEHGPWMPKE